MNSHIILIENSCLNCITTSQTKSSEMLKKNVPTLPPQVSIYISHITLLKLITRISLLKLRYSQKYQSGANDRTYIILFVNYSTK